MELFNDMPIENLNISVRTYNCLKRYGISTVGELSKMTESQLMRIRNLGKENCNDIIKKLQDIGISLALED